MMKKGKLYVVGIGPGYEEHMTPRAKTVYPREQCYHRLPDLLGIG